MREVIGIIRFFAASWQFGIGFGISLLVVGIITQTGDGFSEFVRIRTAAVIPDCHFFCFHIKEGMPHSPFEGEGSLN